MKAMEDILRRGLLSETIVHLHGWTKALSSSVARSALEVTTRVVITMHDYFLACPNGGFFNYPANWKCRLRGMSTECLFSNCDKNSYSQKLWRFVRQLVQTGSGLLPGDVRHFISISDFSEDLLMPYLPPEFNVYHVPNPIDVEQAEPFQPGTGSGILFIGRLDPEKGGAMLAKASRKAGVQVTFTGEGPEKGAIVRENPEAVFTGWLERPQVVRQLSQCRALVLPSLWYETQGLVVLEAAACGVPSVVPDDCAAADMVVDGQTGLVFRSGDEESLIRQLSMLNDEDLVSTMGLAAYESYWNSPSTMNKHVISLEKAYADILSSP